MSFALTAHVAGDGEPRVIDGLTGISASFFLLPFGHAWRCEARCEDALRQQVLTDPHSPAEFANGVVRIMDACTGVQHLSSDRSSSPEQRVRIW
jgi:putative endopeptidase